MNVNDDNFDFSHKPKKGRRANTSQNSVELGSMDTQIPIISKKSGWADETLKSTKNRPTTNLIEQQRFQEQKIDIDDNIPIMPDIEEIHDEGFENDIARAPSTTVKNTSTYKELDKQLLEKSPLGQLGDIDLSYLTRFMYSRDEITEADETWTRDSLFQELITNTNHSDSKQ